MTRKGYIVLDRAIRDSVIWESEEPFDIRSAWIDLVMSANYAEGKIVYRNRLTTINRGQFFTSTRKLATRWRWGHGRVLNFLRMLESNGSITVKRNAYGTLITLVNYGLYQDTRSTDRNADANADGTHAERARNKKKTNKTPMEKQEKRPACAEEDDDDGLPAEEAMRQWQASMSSSQTTPSA